MKLKRLLCGLLLSLAIVTFCLLFMVVAAGDAVISVNAGKECLNATFNKISGATSYNAYVKNENDNDYTKIDNELVTVSSSNVRVDAVGLAAGNYYLKLVPIINSQENESKQIELKDITVAKEDRSGYAHHNYNSGVGAYNDDGTLKSGTVVVYVTDETKNTVKATINNTEYTGLTNILQAQKNSSVPLDIRILDEIQTVQWNKVTYTNNAKTSALVTEQAALVGATATTDADNITNVSYSNDLERGITKLNGLQSQAIYKSGKFDSYWNMLEFESARDVTIEGIGEDAGIYQWGFTVKKSNSIEFKNLYFTDYPEDAIGIQGNKNSDINYSNYWLHNLTFNEGLNNWDLSYEQDKGDGDGSSDFKYAHNLTISYCKYNGTHKTNLIGSGDDCLQYNVTLHHNYYLNCKSRLPLLRQSNCHIYNNYYDGTTSTGISVRAYAYAFIENNYFAGKNPFMLGYKNDTVDPTGTTIKAIGNVFADGITTTDASNEGVGLKENGIYVLTSSGSTKTYSSNTSATRTTKSSGSVCSPDGSTDYTNFDTNSELFYLENGVTDVEVMNNASELPTLIPTVAGAGIYEAAEYTLVYNSSIATIVDDDFSNATINTVSNGVTPSSAGIYQQSEGDDYTNNYLTCDSNGLYLYDSSKTYTTIGYYIFEDTYNDSIVTYTVKYTPSSANTKWTIITFLDGETNFLIRTNTDSSNVRLGYSLDGGTTVNNMLAFAANTTYTIKLTIDYKNEKASLDINDNIVNNINYAKGISGLKFVTSQGSERYAHVNSVKVTAEDNLKLGYQLGSYTQNNTEYKALRIIGKLEYNEIYDNVEDVDNVVINITIKNSSGTTTKTINADIDTFYKSLKLSDNTVVAESGDGIRYYFTVIKGITSAHKGYTINATTTITLKNGTVVECSGFTYEIK